LASGVVPALGAAGPTPAERRIEEAAARVEQSPSSAQGYVDLALALARRARETSDHAFYRRAEEAIATALELSPDNFEALKVKAWVLLGQHDFSGARSLATTLNRRAPDDVMVYGLLTDASAELGLYADAEAACQWMLDLRPGNVPALTRAAYLREMFGDVEGALELMTLALDQTLPGEAEDRAWTMTHIGHLHLLAGRYDRAEQALLQALETFPDYHYALGTLARVRTAQGRHPEAVELLERRQRIADHPENLYELAEALQRAGRKKEAKAAFARFEAVARAEMQGTDNANRELVFYYADHARRPAEALRVARLERARRQDVRTLEAHAWALHRAGHPSEAREEMRAALGVGYRDTELLGRAAAIGVAAQ
jgi:tetratricopeptide (TPR) repeat protein